MKLLVRLACAFALVYWHFSDENTGVGTMWENVYLRHAGGSEYSRHGRRRIPLPVGAFGGAGKKAKGGECAKSGSRPRQAIFGRGMRLHAGGFEPGDTFILSRLGAHQEGTRKHFGCRSCAKIAGKKQLRGADKCVIRLPLALKSESGLKGATIKGGHAG